MADVWHKMQYRWESLAAVWPLGPPPVPPAVPGNRGTPPWSHLSRTERPKPKELLVLWEGIGRERAEQVPPTSD